jgi:tetratricopeptide (TPR) repeat protein
LGFWVVAQIPSSTIYYQKRQPSCGATPVPLSYINTRWMSTDGLLVSAMPLEPISTTLIAGKLADAVISYLTKKGADVALAKPMEWLQEKKRDKAFREAIGRALKHFADNHGELSDSFFDETFLENSASVEIQKYLTLSEDPDPKALAGAYSKYFAVTQEIPELLPACRHFLGFLGAELKANTELKDLVSDRLIRQIWSKISDVAERPPEVDNGRPIPRHPVPHELPPLPPDFTDRNGEAEKLVEAVRKRDKTILAVCGMGGIGKTALAIKVAKTLGPHFPDGEIYIDLRGAPHKSDFPGVPPLTTGQAMDHVIRSFDRGAPVPPNDSARVAEYRTALYDKRALLLMDNALDADQVEQLVPPSGSVMIVTSRQRFALRGIERQDLAKFPREDACQLLLAIAPSIGSQAGDLASLCDYLPEALCCAASTVDDELPNSLRNLLHEMNDARERLKITGVELSLTISSELLSANLRSLWLQLGVFPGTFDVPAVEEVWGIESGVAANALGDLLRRYLIEWNRETERYQLTNLVRDFAVLHLEESACMVAQSRHAAHYRRILAWADHECLVGRVSEGLALFDREWINLRAGQAWAASHAKADKAAAKLVVEYPYVGTDNLFLRKRPREFIEWLDAAREVAILMKNRHNEGVALHGLGKAYESMANYEQSVEYYQQYLALERNLGVPILEGGALFNIALVSQKAGRPADAISSGEAALKVFEKIGTPYAADVRNHLAKWRQEPDSRSDGPEPPSPALGWSVS